MKIDNGVITVSMARLVTDGSNRRSTRTSNLLAQNSLGLRISIRWVERQIFPNAELDVKLLSCYRKTADGRRILGRSI